MCCAGPMPCKVPGKLPFMQALKPYFVDNPLTSMDMAELRAVCRIRGDAWCRLGSRGGRRCSRAGAEVTCGAAIARGGQTAAGAVAEPA